ncbi:MAG: hypothetical protein EAZ89_13435 [Bacteroidetes bacterium]|nr:MAG: hypothetical protein EAZ89_13435 [Bacteroidota bacterium]
MKRFSGVFFLLLIFSGLCAQSDSTTNLQVDRARNFSLVFNRGLMLTTGRGDSVPINGSSSGSIFVGGGIKIPFAKNKLGVRITPGFNWNSITYDQTTTKSFPSIPDSLPYQLTKEKHFFVRPELGAGVYANLTKDEDGDTRFFAEAGGFVSYLLSASYRTTYNNADGQKIQTKVADLETIEDEFIRLHYGIYARLGYKWAAIYYSWRFTPIFDEFTNEKLRPRNVEGYKNPVIPPMELGLSIFF